MYSSLSIYINILILPETLGSLFVFPLSRERVSVGLGGARKGREGKTWTEISPGLRCDKTPPNKKIKK